MHKRNNLRSGGQTALNEDEEQSLIAHIIAVGTYGFPVTTHDLKFVVKSYLDRRGKTVKRFNQNTPGRDWIASFLSRHKQVLVNRVARNISVSRAAVNREVLNDYFDNLFNEIKDIPPCNIWNYD